jgi:hypothetical protein
MAKDIVEQRRTGAEVIRLLDLPLSLGNLSDCQQAAEKVYDIRRENGHTVIVVKTKAKVIPAPDMLWPSAGD